MRRVLFKRFLAWHRLAWLLALLAMLLCAPALDLGWQIDDHFHRASLTRPDLEFLVRSPAGLFDFIRGRDRVGQWIRDGYLPWFTDPELSIGFFRPLSGLTHWFDYLVWPDDPRLMHFHSLLWLAAAVLAAGAFYRRLFGRAWVAGLALLLFAVEDAHGMATVWLANRNALVGLVLGLLALLAHQRWRYEKWLPGSVLAPAAFLLALLANEGALAVGGYLLSYALFLDRGTRLRRLATLLPCGLVGLAWVMAYRLMGYGVTGSGIYVDPASDPLHFLGQAARNAPLLLAGQLGFPSDLVNLMPAEIARVVWLITLAALALSGTFLLPLIRRDRLARFFLTGMLLSIIPVCSTTASNRLLHFAGIGGSGLMALFLAAALSRDSGLPTSRWYRRPARAAAAVLIIIHLGLSPIVLALTAGYVRQAGDLLGGREAAGLPLSGSAQQVVVTVSTPTVAINTYAGLIQILDGGIRSIRGYVLGSGVHPLEIRRIDERTLLLTAEGGFLAPPGSPVPGEEASPPVDVRNIYRMFDRIYRGSRPFTAGRRIELADLEVVIRQVTADGRPEAGEFHFHRPLEDSLYHWVRWQDHAFTSFTPPAVGESVLIPAVTVPFADFSY
jgi:hypothetical protein